MKLRVGYLGPAGSNSHFALGQYVLKTNHTLKEVPFKSFRFLFDALESNQIDKLLLPLENSIGGSVDKALDLLSSYDSLYISDELIFTVNLAFMSNHSIETPFKEIISHPQCLAQCDLYIQKNQPHSLLTAAPSSSDAIQIMLKKSTPTYPCAVIGHASLANQKGVQLLQKNIQDTSNNQTRFGLISKSIPLKTGCDKTSIVFSTQQNQPGSLLNVLSEFKKKEINLTQISSRPTKNKLGDYLFFVDFDGHHQDSSIQTVLNTLQKKTCNLKLLGSYRKYI